MKKDNRTFSQILWDKTVEDYKRYRAFSESRNERIRLVGMTNVAELERKHPKLKEL